MRPNEEDLDLDLPEPLSLPIVLELSENMFLGGARKFTADESVGDDGESFSEKTFFIVVFASAFPLLFSVIKKHPEKKIQSSNGLIQKKSQQTAVFQYHTTEINAVLNIQILSSTDASKILCICLVCCCCCFFPFRHLFLAELFIIRSFLSLASDIYFFWILRL